LDILKWHSVNVLGFGIVKNKVGPMLHICTYSAFQLNSMCLDCHFLDCGISPIII